MKRLVCVCLCALSTIAAAFAIEVDQNELRQADNQPIEFINYTGAHREVDSLRAIADIGRRLAGAVTKGRAGDMNRYAVIHAVDTAATTGLDADILIIGKSARVDHITNLRVIIASYLRAAYAYSEQDARTIAHFITLYNAVYRGDMNAFKARYKDVVIKHLTADKAGLAVRYDEWPGKTQIIIPLSDVKYSGTLSAIDTTSISDKKVVEKMREQDDMDIAARKNMIDLKERESEAARERAGIAQGEADATQKEAGRKQKEATAAQKDADKSAKQSAQAEKEAAAAKKQAEKDPNNQQAVKDAEKKQKEAEKKQQETAAKQKDAEAKQKEADEAAQKAQDKRKEASDENRFADKKDAEVQSDRKDVAADTRKIIEDNRDERKAQDEDALASALPGAMLRVVNPSNMLSEIVIMDLRTGKTVKTSSLNTIRGRSLLEGQDSLIAIAGTKSGNDMITLIAINPHTLEITKRASVAVAEQSMLARSDSGYYAVIEQGGKYYLGRFNEQLEMQGKSVMEVPSYTAVIVTAQGIMVQDTANAIRLLNKETLAEVVR